MKGRKAIPNAIKRATGNGRLDSGKRIIPDEPQAKPGPPPAPPEILADPDAKAAWDLFVQEAPAGVVTHADRAALVLLSQTWASLQADAKAMGHESVVVVNGQPQRTPYFEAFHKNAGLALKLLAEFGMSPSSRSRIQMPKLAEADDKIDF